MSTRPVVPDSEAVEAHFAHSAERRRSGRRIIWGILIGFAFLLMLTPLVMYLAWQARGRALLRAELEQIKANGDPLTTGEMAARHVVPAGKRDITAIWVAAIKPFDTPAFSATAASVPIVGNGAQLPELDQPLPAAEEKIIRDFLSLHQHNIAALYAAAKEEGEVRYARDFRQGIAMLIPEAQQIRSAVRVLDLEFELLAREEDPKAAIENLKTRFAAGETLRHEPILISLLVRIAVHAMSFDDIQRLAEFGELNDAQLAQLQDMVRAIDIHAQMPEALLGERVWCYHAFHQQVGFVPTLDNMKNEVRDTTNDVSEVKRPEDCAMSIRLMTEMKEATEKSPPEMLDAMEGFEHRIKQLRGGDMSFDRFRYLLTMQLMPALHQTSSADARGEVMRDLTDLALAVRRYHLEHGQPPATVDDLVPAFLPKIPIDSFDGQPLRLQPQETGVLLYSVGKDRRDDGGDTDTFKMEPDIAVEVKLPK